MGCTGAGPSYRAVRAEALAEELADRCLRIHPDGHTLRVLVDGADAAQPSVLCADVAARLRAAGRASAVLTLADWWRPASLRLEHGPQNPDAYRDLWFDYAGLRREVLDPLGPGGSGTWLPALRDAAADRATRAARERAPSGLVLLVAGPMLLGRGLAAEITVHLHLSDGALLRRTDAHDRWTVPALVEHERDADSDEVADVVVRADHPERLAVRYRCG